MIIQLKHKGGLSRDQANDFIYTHRRIQGKIEKYFMPKIIKAIVDQYTSFIDAIKSHGYAYAKSNIVAIVGFAGIAKVIKELYRKAAFIQANNVLRYINRRSKKGFDFKRIGVVTTGGAKPTFGISLEDLAPVIDSYFDIHLLNESALPITRTTRQYIIKHLVSEVDAGKDLNQALEDFTSLAITEGREYAPIRAKKIALTETTKALSFGGLIGAYMTGLDVDKTWVTCDDERVRDPNHPMYRNIPVPYPHTKLDLQEAELLGSFYNGENIRFPGDPSASFENTIMCRCALYYKKKSDREREDRDMVNFLIDMRLNEILNT